MRQLWRKLSACIFISLIFLAELPAGDSDYVADPSDAVKLALPERRNANYFAQISPDILSNIEKGSPESLQYAINSLQKRQENLSESEEVVYFIAVSIMQICWKSQNYHDTFSSIDIKNDYTGAITSSRNGIYDPFVSPKDFLGYALPALVLAASETRNDYYESALENLSAALKINSTSVFANYLLGLLYRRMNDYHKANEYFGYASDLAGNCFECSYAFADSFLKLNDPSAAFSLCEKMLKTYPQNKDLLKLCAESAFAAKDAVNAELYVSRVLQLEPENSYYLLFRARILVFKGEYIRAASLLDAYARKDSDSRDYLLLRFEIQKNWNKNISAATATIEKAIILYPEDKDIILNAAILSSETGTSIAGESGEDLANKILASDPENFQAILIKINSMVAAKKWSQAYKASTELLKKDNLPRSVYFVHIRICLSAGKKDEAWRYASRLYAEDQNDEEVLQSYIDVLVSTSRTAEASRLINQLLPNSTAKMKSFLYYQRSYLTGSESAILADLRSSLTANPRNKDALFRLYKIYFNKKEYRKAQYYLKQVVALSPKDESLLALNQNLDKLLKN